MSERRDNIVGFRDGSPIRRLADRLATRAVNKGQGWDVDGLISDLVKARAENERLTAVNLHLAQEVERRGSQSYEAMRDANTRLSAAVQAVRDLPVHYVYYAGEAEGAAFLDRYAVLAALDGERDE